LQDQQHRERVKMTKRYIILIALALLNQLTYITVAQDYQQGYDNDYTESVSIHTDRDFYIAGERIYFRINIDGNDSSPVSSLAYIALRNQDNTVISFHTIRISGNIGSGSIYLPDTLTSQVCQLVAFTNWMRNFSEDYYASRQISVVNRFDEEPGILTGNPDTNFSGHTGLTEFSVPASDSQTTRIITDKAVYGTREKVMLQVVQGNKKNTTGSISVSVAGQQSLNNHSIQPKADNKKNDHILRTRGNIHFYKELNGPVMTGYVTDKASGRPLAGVMVVLTTPDTVLNLQYARTITDGTFHFMLNDYYEERELYFAIYDREIASTAGIRIIDKFRLEKPFQPDLRKIVPLSPDFVRVSQDIVRTNKTLNIDHNNQVETEKHGYRNLIYSSPAYSFDLFEDYEYLGSMQEISRELIPFLRIRRQDDNYSSTLMLDFAGSYTPQEPVYFLDGVYTDNINRIINLNSDDLQKLEIHNFKWRYGELILPGIVALFSKNHEYRNIHLSDPQLSYKHSLTAHHAFYRPPDHGKDELPGYRPDFRQLLFWDPHVIINEGGVSEIIEFYTGDITGEFLIRVAGHSNDEFITGESAFIVTRDEDALAGRKIYDIDFTGKSVNSNSLDISLIHSNRLRKNNTGYEYFEQGLSGIISAPPGRLIGNQHYPSEDWIKGNVILENDITVENKLLRYNSYLDNLFWLSEGDYQQVQLDKKLIREFELLLPGNQSPAKFRRIKVNAPLYTGKNEIYGELLHEGEYLSLYAYRRVIETTRGDFVAGNKLYGGMKIKPSHLYLFVLPDGSTRVIKRIKRRNILDLFPESRNDIRSIIRENKKWIHTVKDLTEIARLIDEYLSGKSIQ
jgi:hypothetical protein